MVNTFSKSVMCTSLSSLPTPLFLRAASPASRPALAFGFCRTIPSPLLGVLVRLAYVLVPGIHVSLGGSVSYIEF